MLQKRPFTSLSSGSGYSISNSVIFDEDLSQYASRSFASNPGVRTKAIYSFWVKLNEIKNSAHYFFTAGDGSTLVDSIDLWNSDFKGFRIILGNSVANVRSSNNVAVNPQLYFDYSAWMHIWVKIDTTQANAVDRINLYVNGRKVGLGGTYPSQNYNLTGFMQSSYVNYIGKTSNVGRYYNGYMSEVHAICGDAPDFDTLTVFNFGEFSNTTGEWVPVEYTGNYGTNGYYLNFSDPTSLSTLFNDQSSNNNGFTPTNFSSVDLSQVLDTPTNNFATWDAFHATTGMLFSKGNLTASRNLYFKSALSTIAFRSGKWHVEVELSGSGTAANGYHLGIIDSKFRPLEALDLTTTSYTGNWHTIDSRGNYYDNGVATSHGQSFASGDTIIMEIDADNGSITYYKNNILIGSRTIEVGVEWNLICQTSSNVATLTYTLNVGQFPFSYSVTPGFQSLCSENLSDPVVMPIKIMDFLAYTGNGTSQSISNLRFSPDLVWIKTDDLAQKSAVFDTVRGATKLIEIDFVNPESTDVNSLTSFDSTGFSVGSSAQVNSSGKTELAYCWKKTPQLFDIVSYSGNTGVPQTHTHNLGVKPDLIVCKNLTASTEAIVYHSSMGATKYLQFLSNSAATVSSDAWNNTEPTATDFTTGIFQASNGNTGDNLIAYLFADVEGICKTGLIKGVTSSNVSNFYYCGFKPAFVLVKCITSSGNWFIFDDTRKTFNKRNNPYLVDSKLISTNTTSDMMIFGNGFSLYHSALDVDGDEYIFVAFAKVPIKYARGV